MRHWTTRDSFDEYYMPLVEMNDFNGSVHNKPFHGRPVKSKQEAYERFVEMLRQQ